MYLNYFQELKIAKFAEAILPGFTTKILTDEHRLHANSAAMELLMRVCEQSETAPDIAREGRNIVHILSEKRYTSFKFFPDELSGERIVDAKFNILSVTIADLMSREETMGFVPLSDKVRGYLVSDFGLNPNIEMIRFPKDDEKTELFYAPKYNTEAPFEKLVSHRLIGLHYDDEFKHISANTKVPIQVVVR